MQVSAYFSPAKEFNMMKTKTGGIIIAIACAFVASSMWYSPLLFGRRIGSFPLTACQ
jgi:hypothetical protein